MRWREAPVRAWFVVLTLGTFGLVAASMELQHLLRLAPCPLCIFQRLLYMVIGLVALAGVLLPGGRLLWSALIAALVDWLGMQWPSLFLATGFCTSRDWEFLALSMANWSLLVFAGIVGYAALLFMRKG